MATTTLLEATELAIPTASEPRDEALYEFVDGRWIETPTMSYFASLVASRLNVYLAITIE
jgi:hypothetical protein